MKKEDIKIFIIDDDPSFQSLLKVKLIQLGFTNTFFSLNYEDAIRQFKLILPDFAIIDIHLSTKSGIDLAGELLKIKDIPLIFMTSDFQKDTYEQSKEVSPKAFLSKDFNDLELLQIIELALMDSLRENSSLVQNQNDLESDFIFTKQGTKLIRIYYDEMVSFQTLGNYVQLSTKDKKYIINYSLKKLFEILPKKDFIKVHQSHIVNKKYIQLLNLEQNYIIVNDFQIEISRRYKKELLNLINFI